MITVRPENFRTSSFAKAMDDMEPFAGRRVGSDEPIECPLDTADSADAVLEYFYNGGAFRGLYTALYRGHSLDTQGSAPVSMHYTFQEPVREGHEPTVVNSDYFGGKYHVFQYERRSYSVDYDPDTHRVVGKSEYRGAGLFGNPTGEQAYHVSVTPSGLAYAEQGSELHVPINLEELAAAKHALQQLVYDGIRDLGKHLSGA